MSNDKSEQKYGGNITKDRKGCSFGFGTLVPKQDKISHNELFSFSTIIPISVDIISNKIRHSNANLETYDINNMAFKCRLVDLQYK